VYRYLRASKGDVMRDFRHYDEDGHYDGPPFVEIEADGYGCGIVLVCLVLFALIWWLV
jgi:hypothetical protein